MILTANIIYRKELFVKATAYILIFFSLGATSISFFHSEILNITILILLLLPLIFIKSLIKKFTHKVEFEMNSKAIICKFLSSQSETDNRVLILRDIISYSIQLPNEKFNSIKFNLQNNQKIEFSFFNKRDNEENNGFEIISTLHSFINEFNNQNNEFEKILLIPSFYASKKGFLIIGTFAILLIASIVIISFFLEKILPVTFVFSSILLIQILIRRKKEKDFFEKLNYT
jgi:hypothetical protein